MSKDPDLKKLLLNPWVIVQFLHAFVDRTITDELDWGTLAPYPTETFGSDNKRRLNDVVWSVDYRNGRQMHVLFIVEAQVQDDRTMVLRIGEYVFNWYLHLSQVRGLDEGLPVIVPVVFYNETRPWTAATRLRDLLAVPEGSGLVTPMVDAEYILVDGRHLAANDELPAGNVFDPLLRVMHTHTLAEYLRQLGLVKQMMESAGQSEAYERVAGFLFEWKRIDEAQDWFKSTEDREVIEMAATVGFPEWREEILQEGIEQGIEQGIERGAEQYSRMILQRLLVQRFGRLDAAAEAKIQQANAEQLGRWLDQVISAPTLSEALD